MSRLDLRAVLIGAAVAAAAATVSALALRLVSETSNLSFAVFAVVMLCMVLGGFLAARPQTALAFTAGAVAAGIAGAAVQVVDIVVRLARGSEVRASFLLGSVFVILLSCSFGVVGGAVALWRERRTASTPEEAST
jgi:hypothetical protein